MLSVRIKVRFSLFEAQCPSCNSTNVRPGMIRPWVEGIFHRAWLLATFRRPYLCRDCDERFYDFRMKARHLATDDPEIQTLLRDYYPLADVLSGDDAATAKKDRTA